MRKYEGVFVFRTDLTEEERKESFARLTGVIENGGKIEKIDEWGQRKLAYEINYYKEGYYYIVNFEAEAETEAEVKRIAKISDTLLRYMIVRVDE